MLKAIEERCRANAKIIRPVLQASRSSIESDVGKVSTVARLFTARRPPTVTRFVVAVYINAVERMLGRWATSQIGEEITKTVPSLANLDAAAPIVGVAPVPWIHAALPHVCPAGVFDATIVRSTVLYAPATLDETKPYVNRREFNLSSAFTLA